MMNDVMLDLETMGVGPNAAIISIGAVAFDLVTGELGQEFYGVIDLQSSVDAGGAIDPATVIWWLRQCDEARKEFGGAGAWSIGDALGQFDAFIEAYAEPGFRMWGNGAANDNTWLANAYRRSGKNPPWAFYQDRCFRTVRSLYPQIAWRNNGVAHNALEDAKAQARYLIDLFKKFPLPDTV